MPLQKGRPILVKIHRGRGHWKVRVGWRRKLAGALEYAGRSVYLLHGLKKKVDDFRMEVAADQHARGRRDKRDVMSRNVLCDINDAFRKVQSHEAGNDTGERLRHGE